MTARRRRLWIVTMVVCVLGVLYLPVALGQAPAAGPAVGDDEADLPALPAPSPVEGSKVEGSAVASAKTEGSPSDATLRSSALRSTGASAKEGLTWKQIVESGGWLMYVLGGMSVLALAFIIYFFVVLRAAQIVPRPLHGELIEKIGSGAIDDAQRACKYRPCPLASVALAAMDYMRNVSEEDPVLLKDVVEGEGGRQAEAIQGQTQYLLDIAVVSPMIGLLGTVFGMLRAFSSVALDIASARPVVLAAGVSQALITTAFGLIVGIPAMMFYAYFRRKASKLVSYLEAASTDVLTALLSKRSAAEERRPN